MQAKIWAARKTLVYHAELLRWRFDQMMLAENAKTEAFKKRWGQWAANGVRIAGDSDPKAQRALNQANATYDSAFDMFYAQSGEYFCAQARLKLLRQTRKENHRVS